MKGFRMNFKIFIFLGFCLIAQAQAEETRWQEKMRAVSNALAKVVPYLYPSADKDVKGLTESVEVLYMASSQLDVKKDHMIKTGDFDPGLLFLSNSFQEDITRAYMSLKDGYTDYARYVLKGSTNYCIACHTRSSNGVQFPLLKAFEEPLKSAPWITRIEFQAASRQFDTVYDEVIAQLKKPKGQALSIFDLERGVRLALSIAIRVKQSPPKALELAQAVSKSKNVNFPMKQAAKDWIRDITAWKKEGKKEFSSAFDMIEEARRLIKRAERSPSQGHDEVNYLRALAVLHDLLRKFPQSQEMPEALYLIGESYRPLQELGLWNLQEKYFQACVLQVPHTELAEKCYKRFEESIVFGFSGSSGTHIPPEMQKQLQFLKNKSQKTKETL